MTEHPTFSKMFTLKQPHALFWDVSEKWRPHCRNSYGTWKQSFQTIPTNTSNNCTDFNLTKQSPFTVFLVSQDTQIYTSFNFINRSAWLSHALKPGVHSNDLAPIYVRRGPKLGHASLATVASRKLSANHNRCNSWCVSKHQMAPWCIYITERRHKVAALRNSLCLDCRGSVGTMNAELSRPDLLATVQPGR